MKTLETVWSATHLGLRSIPARLGTSLVVVVGVAIVVAVFITVLSMATGFTKAAAATGKPWRAIVLGGSAETESGSSIARENIVTVSNAPGIRQAASGDPIVSADMLAFVPLQSRRGGLNAFATVRGVGPASAQLRPEVRIVEGRMFTPGNHEVIVGRGVQARMVGVELGQSIAMPQGDWQIVGVFESGGDSHESELLTDADTLISIYRNGQFNA